MKRLLKFILRIIVSIVVLIAILWVAVTAIYWDFFNQSQPEFFAPGLADGIVPQGFFYLPDSDIFLMSGYMADGSASRIYVRNGAGEEHYVNLCFADGTPYNLHCGGVCASDRFVYIAGETGLDVFLLEDVLTGTQAHLQGIVQVGYRIDYCNFANGWLIAGNFYYPEHYEVPAEHHLQTPYGDYNHGMITLFAEEDAAAFGVSAVPSAALSTTGAVQGAAVLPDGKIMLSTSYSVRSSTMYIYTFDGSRKGQITTAGHTVPMYYLDGENLVKTWKLPPMAEEIAIKGDRAYIVFESASQKYIFGNFIRGTHVYSFVP